jgi:hypothetical protein
MTTPAKCFLAMYGAIVALGLAGLAASILRVLDVLSNTDAMALVWCIAFMALLVIVVSAGFLLWPGIKEMKDTGEAP